MCVASQVAELAVAIPVAQRIAEPQCLLTIVDVDRLQNADMGGAGKVCA